jgi:hypothetical protein
LHPYRAYKGTKAAGRPGTFGSELANVNLETMRRLLADEKMMSTAKLTIVDPREETPANTSMAVAGSIIRLRPERELNRQLNDAETEVALPITAESPKGSRNRKDKTKDRYETPNRSLKRSVHSRGSGSQETGHEHLNEL